MSGTLGVVLAAGASRRFGAGDKLLAAFQGGPLVRAAADALRASGVDACAAVVSSEAVAAALPEGFAVRYVAPGQPMAGSFHAALDLAQGYDRLLIVLGDMPGVGTELLRRVLAQAGSACCFGAGRMPPMVLSRADFAAARAAAVGDRGARGFLATLPDGALVALTEAEARDIDLRSDLP